jgi:hypothetical protein
MRQMQRCSACFGDLQVSDRVQDARQITLTEHFPSNSKVRAEGIETGDMVQLEKTRPATATDELVQCCGPFA